MEGESNKKNSGLLDMVSRFFPGRKRVTEEEIQELMNAGEEEGLINEEENQMIRSILALGDTVVREIMVPRTDMACVSVDAGVKDVLKAIIACGHSRIPVYEETIDNIIGLIYAKDLLKYWEMNDEAIILKKIIRAPYFIPESKNLEELLHEFKKKRVHIAIVIDEYGGTSCSSRLSAISRMNTTWKRTGWWNRPTARLSWMRGCRSKSWRIASTSRWKGKSLIRWGG